jgi:hypothetical protein
LERLTRTVGADHPLTLELRSFYHKIQYRGRYREAEPLLRAVKDDALRVLGSRDPVTLTAMSDYAIVLAELERYAEAAEVARQTIDFKDKVYGVDHPQTMPTMTTLAVILSKLDRHDEARELAEHVLAVRRRVLGAEHPQTLITAVILGGVYVNAHMIAEAAALLPPLQEDLARVIGPEHPGTLNVGLLRATLAVDAGTLDEAEHAIREMEHLDLDYVEQPVESVADMAVLRQRMSELGIGIAADESIRRSSDITTVLEANACDVVVLKVQPLGGIAKTLVIAAKAREAGCVVVV